MTFIRNRKGEVKPDYKLIKKNRFGYKIKMFMAGTSNTKELTDAEKLFLVSACYGTWL
jgi:predicted ATP-dependent serine protease